MQRLGVIGLGSVFTGPYRRSSGAWRRRAGRAVAVYDVDAEKRAAGARLVDAEEAASPEELIARDDVDVVLVLTA